MAEMAANKIIHTEDGLLFERFSLNQRIQHWILIVSFLSLVITGMPIRYPESAISETAIMLMGGIGVRSIIHRIAALLLIGVSLYHVFYTLFSERGYRDFRAMLFGYKDITDMIHMMKFYVGLERERPRFARFSFQEKFEYYAMGWGTVVMAVTGFMLWFPGLTSTFLPKWGLDIARIIHSWEGLLAILAIIISHMYTVHLNPDVFPMSKVWLTGKMTEKEMKHHHPLEYEAIMAQSKDKE